MSAANQPQGLPSLGFLVMALGCVAAAPVSIATKTLPARDTVSLSESLAVTLSLEGPAPLRVEPPSNWLSEQSAEVWKVNRIEPATLAPLPGGRERWSVTLHVDPFIPGDAVPLQFASATVTAGGDVSPQQVTWDGLEVRVVSTLNAKDAQPRPITGIETLPPTPPAEPVGHHDRLAAAFAAIAVAGVMLIIARRLHRREPETPQAWAKRELDRLAHEPSPQCFDRLSQVLRGFVERRFQIPATRLTTAELLLEAERADGGLRNVVADLRRILERCDAVKFARGQAAAEECRFLVDESRRLVDAGVPAAPVADS